MALQPDYRDILAEFARAGVEYLVVGGYAEGFLGATPPICNALAAFGAPQVVIDQLEVASERDVLWMGVPPVRIDIVKAVPGGDWDGVEVSLVNRTDLIALKRASGRPQDILDADALERG